MKTLLSCYFFLLPFLGSSQSVIASPLATVSTKTYGYIDGKRLDSIDAEYAQFDLGISSVSFDYGQTWTRREDLYLKDNSGNDLFFANDGNLAFALNFFYYNGWQLDHINNSDKSRHMYILKRIRR